MGVLFSTFNKDDGVDLWVVSFTLDEIDDKLSILQSILGLNPIGKDFASLDLDFNELILGYAAGSKFIEDIQIANNRG